MRLLLIALALCGSARADGTAAEELAKIAAQIKAAAAAWKPAPIPPKTLRGIIDALGGDKALEQGAVVEGEIERTAGGGTRQEALSGASDVYTGEDPVADQDAVESRAVNRPHVIATHQVCGAPVAKRMRCTEWTYTITMKSEISKVVRTRSDYDVGGSGEPVLDDKSVVRERLKPGEAAALDKWKELAPRLLVLQPAPISA